MDIGHYLRRLWRLRYIVAVVSVIALLLGASTGYDLGIAPPQAKRKMSVVGTATTQMLVDSPRSPIGDLSLQIAPLTSRASLYVAFLRSEPVRAIMAEKAGLPPGAALIIESAGSGAAQPGAGSGAESTRPVGSYVVVFSTSEGLPIINVRTQAPTQERAELLATAAVSSARQYVSDLQSEQAIAPANRVGLRPIGPPLGLRSPAARR